MKHKQAGEAFWTYKQIGVVACTVFFIGLGLIVQQLQIREKRGRWGWFYRPQNAAKLAVWLRVKPSISPWTLTPADLNWERALYNVLTKSGFLDLGVLVILAMTMLYSGFLAAAAAFQWQWRQLQVLSHAARQTLGVEVSVELAGTVKISARRGVIYVYKRVAENEVGAGERYSYSWVPVRVRIEYTI